MGNQVTIQEIARQLNLSRSTVSKALNGNNVPAKTKNAVLQKAVELGYKSFDFVSRQHTKKKYDKILILSSKTLICANYYVYLIRGIEAEAQKNGLEVLQYIFRPHSDFEMLKDYIKQFEVDGIICIEFFSEKSISEILSLRIPILFIDFSYRMQHRDEYFDVLLMESFEAVKTTCDMLLEKGVSTIGFIGNPYHCKSFNERYLGMREALHEHGLAERPDLCILQDSSFAYGDSTALAQQLLQLKQLPDCFVCANDFIALALLKALKQIRAAKRRDISIIGFDNIPESNLCVPKLSTVHIDKTKLGNQAVRTLIERIESPTGPNRVVYIKSNFIHRETTRPLGI